MRYVDAGVRFDAESLSEALNILQRLEKKNIIEVTGPYETHTQILYGDTELWGEYYEDFNSYVIGARYDIPEYNLDYVHRTSGAIMELREDIENKTNYSFDAALWRPIAVGV